MNNYPTKPRYVELDYETTKLYVNDRHAGHNNHIGKYHYANTIGFLIMMNEQYILDHHDTFTDKEVAIRAICATSDEKVKTYLKIKFGWLGAPANFWSEWLRR